MSENQYNSLPSIPEGSEWDGAQHRKTEFDSPEAKAAYDASGLLQLARTTYEKKIVTVGEALDLRRRGNEVSVDDDVEVSLLRRAMEIELTKKPKWEAFVDGLGLSDENREKLRAMLTPESYELSLSAYHEMGGTKEPPTLDQIQAEVMTWSMDRLCKECEMREKPTLLIVSDNSFGDGIKAMNRNKHYRNSEGRQRNTYVNYDEDPPYVNAPKPTKNCVTITDEVPNPKKPDELPIESKAARDAVTTKYIVASMRHIEAVESQNLLQRSLIEADEAGDMSLVVDN